MTDLREHLSPAVVKLPRPALRRMVALARLLDRLSRNPAYCERVAADLPEVARFDPGHAAVMMCYDFHLAPDGPWLIEVNTNAGGGLPASMAGAPDRQTLAGLLRPQLHSRLLDSFATEMQLFSAGAKSRPERLVIVDEDPAGQFLYPEMQAFAELFESWGVPTAIVAPHQLEASAAGVFLAGQRIDLVYNRHCDFYLESEAMAGLRAAYLAGAVCLSPNPRAYGLLADKRRMCLWTDELQVAGLGLTAAEQQLLKETVPASFLLADLDAEQVWQERKRWVFKPVDRFGSRGVLLGEKASRVRFEQQPPATTLVQQRVEPSLTEVPGFETMKTDFRLYAYRGRMLGVTARLYRGQVTNLRTPGGGFAAVRVS